MAYQSLHASPIAPAWTPPRVDATLDVDVQPVGQAVGVLVVDRVGLVADVGRRERVAVRVRRAGLVLEVHLHLSGGGRRAASACWRCRCGSRRADRAGRCSAPSSVWVLTGSPALAGLAAVDQLEVAGGLGEADRCLLQVVVPVVDEVEDLRGVLGAVGAPRERLVRVPRARPRVAAERLREAEVERLQLVAPRVRRLGAAPLRASTGGCCR